jgi:uncharacterized FlaG/YvyC family protein
MQPEKRASLEWRVNISSIQPNLFFPDAAAPQDRIENSADRQQLVQAVKAVNDSNALGDKNELTFVLDRNTHRTLVRLIDRNTQEVVMQIPPEYVLRLAEQLKQQ